MTLSVSPEMKFFRWILSHLTIIVILSIVLYLFFSYYMFKSDSDNADSATNSMLMVTDPQLEDKQNTNNSHVNTIAAENLQSSSRRNSPDLEKTPVSNAFSQRQEEYRQRLSAEERKTMDQAVATFEQKSQAAISYPAKTLPQSHEIEEFVVSEELSAKNPVSEPQEIRYPSDEFQETKLEVNYVENYSESHIPESHVFETHANDNKAAIFSQKQPEDPDKPGEEVVAQIMTTKPVQATIEEAPAQILSEVATQAESEKFARLKTDIPLQISNKTPVQAVVEIPVRPKNENVSGIKPEVELAEDKKLPMQQERLGAHDKNLQHQIRQRQKQLQERMIRLIPLNSHKKTADNIAENPTNSQLFQPLVSTAEQQQLLYDARQAFDSHEFKVAETKYIQLINQLPEHPDVVGELANVFKTQHKISEYLRANTLFVKRLLAQERYNEAWRVVSATDKIDPKTAEKQRGMINNKQKELPGLNKRQ